MIYTTTLQPGAGTGTDKVMNFSEICRRWERRTTRLHSADVRAPTARLTLEYLCTPNLSGVAGVFDKSCWQSKYMHQRQTEQVVMQCSCKKFHHLLKVTCLVPKL